METENLKTASTYINNLLLARGLLRNGEPIELATPSHGKSGTEGTMAQVINLIHDMVLRRDRETETLTTFSHSIRTLREITVQQTQQIGRLEGSNTDLARQLALSSTQELNAKNVLRNAESKNKLLREEMGRLKMTVAQIRSQCANDLRKRDMEIARLKKHLEGRRSRDGGLGQVGVVVITPGQNMATSAATHRGLDSNAAQRAGSPPSSTLRDDTAAFLTELSQGLTAENHSLMRLVQNTLSTLMSLQGLESAAVSSSSPSRSIQDAQVFIIPDKNVSTSLPPSYEQLAANMTSTLAHLRELLTNPSFVPLEELETRDEEIARLRTGWEKMDARWQEAVIMMEGWRRRMTETGDTVKIEDLTKGMTLGAYEGPDTPQLDESSLADGENQGAEGLSAVLEENDDDTVQLPLAFVPMPRITDLPIPDLRPKNHGVPSQFAIPALSPSPGASPRVRSPIPLSPNTGNAQSKPTNVTSLSKGKAVEPEPINNWQDESSLQSDDPANLLLSPSPAPYKVSKPLPMAIPYHDDESSEDPLFDFSAFPTPREALEPADEGLSVGEKLDRVKNEAEEARNAQEEAALMKEADPEDTPRARPNKEGSDKGVKRAASKSKRGKKRSTLSPEELEDLLSIG
ncbi:hypothetical protein MMC25_007382 [Agyrium rufum]|nr:hypothetical protein [Agyrium rufum]